VSAQVPLDPTIYHITHVDRLASIVSDSHLWCDAEVARRNSLGTTIGMSKIKRRRLEELSLESHPGLLVGGCVPFYFCPRSVMLYLISRGNAPDLDYRDGDEAIIHLEADLNETVRWAETEGLRWAFTLSNAGSYYFKDRCQLSQLSEIDWAAVGARLWSDCKEGKQAEFLVEARFPWELVKRIGVKSRTVASQVSSGMRPSTHKPKVEVLSDWYY